MTMLVITDDVYDSDHSWTVLLQHFSEKASLYACIIIQIITIIIIINQINTVK